MCHGWSLYIIVVGFWFCFLKLQKSGAGVAQKLVQSADKFKCRHTYIHGFHIYIQFHIAVCWHTLKNKNSSAQEHRQYE